MTLTRDQIRDKYAIPPGRSRGPAEIVWLATMARSSVLRARGAIRAARATGDHRVRLMWETLAQNLYGVEESIAQKVMPPLDAKDVFGPLGAGSVAPVPIDGKPSMARFLGRRMPLDAVVLLRITFDATTEEDLKIVTMQAREVEGYFRARSAPEGVEPGAIAAVALAALFW